MKVAFFAFDIAEASHIRTARAIRDIGAGVESYSFRRANMNRGFSPEWPDHPLGHTENGVGSKRLIALIRASLRLLRWRGDLLTADVFLARNADMATLALIARWLSGNPAPLVYQCLDIHGAFTRPGWRGALARWLERRVLARTARLVISSRAFQTKYFTPQQGWQGEYLVLENKIHWTGPPPDRPAARREDGPLRIGWIGTLRDPHSLNLLVGLAAELGSEAEIVLRGVVHEKALPNLPDTLASHANIRLEADYSYPEGLAEAYCGIDLVWAQDLWQRGGNSDWLLPNRVYEAGYFGCPCVALAGTETARYILQHGLGYSIAEATVPALVAFVRSLDAKTLAARRRELLRKDPRLFCLSPDAVRAMIALPRTTQSGTRAHAA